MIISSSNMAGPLSIDIRWRIIRVYYHNKRVKRYSEDINYMSISRRIIVSTQTARKYESLFKSR